MGPKSLVYVYLIPCVELIAPMPSSYSAFIVFLPVFIVAGCLCCILSCAVCSMAPPGSEENMDD